MSQDHTVQTIVTALNETEERPRTQIAAIVRALGEDAALAILVEANQIEATGGMMLPDGSRRRTPGGVFFAVARRRLSPEDREAIFPKTPPARKDGEKAEEAPPARPDRRNVRLIRPGEPPRARSESLGTVGAGASVGSSVSSSNGLDTSRSTNGVEQGKPEVKLVRLDRRRIVTLPPPPPPPPEEPRPAKRGGGRGKGRRSGGRNAKLTSTGDEQLELELSGPAGLDLALERAQIKKRVIQVLADVHSEQRRLVLLDLLADVPERPGASEAPQPPPPPAPAPAPSGPTPELRTRILASVGDRLGLHVGVVASTIYGEDTPGNRRRVRMLTKS
jgi:hypothetical protein